MIAPRSRTEPALPTTSRGRPSRSTIDGAIIDVNRAPAFVAPARSNSPSMLFRWIPVPGTTTPEPDPATTRQRRGIPRRRRRPRCASCPRRSRRARPPRQQPHSRSCPSRASFCSRMASAIAAHRLRRARRAARGALELLQAVRDQDAARRRRRVRAELVAAVLRTHRPPAHDAVLLEVAPREHARRAPARGDDRLAELALVELARARAPRSARACPQDRDWTIVSPGLSRSVAAVDLRDLRRCPEDHVDDRVQVGLRLRVLTPARARSTAGCASSRQGMEP